MKRLTVFVATFICALGLAAGAANADPTNNNSFTFTCDGLTLIGIVQNDAWSAQVQGSMSVFVWKAFTFDGRLVGDVPGNFNGKDLMTCSGTFLGRDGNIHSFTATGFLT